MTMERMYTTKEVAKILNIDYKRVAKDLSCKILKPTDIEKGIGRGGVRYVFDADAVRFYASKRGIYDVDFSVVGGEEDVIDEDGGIKLTPENFERVVHGNDKPTETKKDNRNANILNWFKTTHNMSNSDLAYIMGVSKKRVDNLIGGHVTLTYDNVVALCAAANIDNFTINPDDWFRYDPERLKALRSWVPYNKAKLLQEYADLQARMKEIEKELEAK